MRVMVICWSTICRCPKAHLRRLTLPSPRRRRRIPFPSQRKQVRKISSPIAPSMVAALVIVVLVGPVGLAVPDKEAVLPAVVAALLCLPTRTAWWKDVPATSDCPPG